MAIGDAIRRVVHNMRHRQHGADSYVRGGLAAIDLLAFIWPRLPELANGRLAQTLSALHERIRDSTGGALYRSLQARFEHEAAALLRSPRLGQAAVICDDVADAWRAFAAALDDDAARAHALSRTRLDRVRSLEHRHVKALEAHLSARGHAPAQEPLGPSHICKPAIKNVDA